MLCTNRILDNVLRLNLCYFLCGFVSPAVVILSKIKIKVSILPLPLYSN